MELLVKQVEEFHVEEQILGLLVKYVEENNWLWGCLSNKLRSEEVHLEQLVVVLPIREEEVHVGKHKSFSGICFNFAAFCNITSLAKGPLVY